VSVITPAASVLLSRGPGSRDVFAILRGAHLKFFGGFWAFPGGKLTELEARSTDPDDARRYAACRELFEETGILMARHPDGSFPNLTPEFADSRRMLLDERLSFEDLLAHRSLKVHQQDFSLIGEITTPEFAPVRYATTFFVAHLPPGQLPDVWPGELERGAWMDVAEVLTMWRSGDALVTPPSAMTMQLLGEHAVDHAPRLLGPLFQRLHAGAIHPILFAPCVQMIPLKTVALPPSAYTNAYLVGAGPRYLIDPGAHETDEQLRLFDLLDELGQPLAAIILSHHHPDHVDGAAACASRYGVPIWAHERTAHKLRGRLSIDRHLQEGDRLDLGACPADGRAWFLDVLHTPGHASGHLVFFEPRYRLLFAGDMISTLSSVVIAPPDGNLIDYLRSLRRMRELPARLLLPSHGNVSARPVETIDAAIAHRAKREAQLLETLADGPAGIDAMTERMYRGTPEPLMRFARAQVLAGLLKLQEEGRAKPVDAERWQKVEVHFGQ
jgi:glyoxylase-like metal-dependent hydrolase (beta-lactamase superfamily II)/8-oxo-dGTP pyrophosphatase MutT (NUDIX family)